MRRGQVRAIYSTMPRFKQRIKQALDTRRNQGLTRTAQVLSYANSAVLAQGDTNYVNFSSNDYLGLAGDPELVSAWQEALAVYGAGSAASPMVTGHTKAHANLQSALSDWLGFEDAVLFNSGFSANQAALFTLAQPSDTLIQDKLNHASLIEAGMLSAAKMQRFAHNNLHRLHCLLLRHDNALVVTEGVFSMDGDTSPLSDITQLCKKHDAWLMVDDAHGLGVLGEEGRGSCDQQGVKPNLMVATFGKAVGISGAAILCDRDTANYLRQFARHYVYSTAMPPAQAVAVTQAIQMIRTQQWRRDKLWELQHQFATSFSGLSGYVKTQTPIKPYVVGESVAALTIANKLRQRGFWVTAIRPPTVPINTARIRFTLNVNHTVEQVMALGRELTQIEGSQPLQELV